MIFCEFDYCIYYNEGKCSLDNLRVSSIGVCDSCKLPNIDPETLNKYKKSMLDKEKSSN